jgi:hypothetical protein
MIFGSFLRYLMGVMQYYLRLALVEKYHSCYANVFAQQRKFWSSEFCSITSKDDCREDLIGV